MSTYPLPPSPEGSLHPTNGPWSADAAAHDGSGAPVREFGDRPWLGMARFHKVLDRLLQKAVEAPYLQPVFDQAVTDIVLSLDADSCSILSLQAERTELVRRASFGFGDAPCTLRLAVDGARSQSAYTLSAGSAVVVPDLSVEQRFEVAQDEFPDSTTGSMSIAIPPHGERHGVLMVGWAAHEVPPPEATLLLSAMSSLLSTAITRLNAESAGLKFRALVESSSDAVLQVTPDGAISGWNAGAEQLLGYSPAEASGLTADVLLQPDGRLEPRKLLEWLQSGESVDGYALELLHKSGRQVPAWLTLAPVRDGNGEVCGVVALARPAAQPEPASDRDGTAQGDRSIDHERLRQAEAAAALRTEMVATVSHEMRSPINTILGFAELLRSGESQITAGTRLEYLTRIVEAARRQQRLIQDLLPLTKLDVGLSAPRREIVDVGRLVRQVTADLAVAYSGQEVTIDGADGLLAVGDVDGVLQIITNLLENAVKYSPEGSPVAVSWRVEEGQLVVRVTDRGPGIPAEGRSRLFTQFGRIRGIRARGDARPVGLGLYVSRRLANAMDGELDLEQSGPQGSVFLLRLQLAFEGHSPAAVAGF